MSVTRMTACYEKPFDNFGFHGSLFDENANINGRSWYTVDVKTHTATNENKRYAIVFEYSAEETISTNRMRRLLAVFAKHELPGFVEWLGGARGWRFDDCHYTAVDGGGGGASPAWKRLVVIKPNTLQEVFELFPDKKYMIENTKRMV